MIQIYNEQLEYIFRSGNNENAYFATTVTPKVDEIKNNSSSDIIFFNNSLTSYKGKKPIEISERKTIGWRKDIDSFQKIKSEIQYTRAYYCKYTHFDFSYMFHFL